MSIVHQPFFLGSSKPANASLYSERSMFFGSKYFVWTRISCQIRLIRDVGFEKNWDRLVWSLLFYCLGIDRKLLSFFFPPLHLNFFSSSKLKAAFHLRLFCAWTAYNQRETQTFRLSCNNFMGSCLINFHSALAESWRIESSQAFMKPHFCTSHTFHACPCSGFCLDSCSTLQWGYMYRAAKASAWYGVSGPLHMSTCIFIAVMLKFGSDD